MLQLLLMMNLLLDVVIIFSDEVIFPTDTISFVPIVKLPFNTDVVSTYKLPHINFQYQLLQQLVMLLLL
jgi:hypothetical protein